MEIIGLYGRGGTGKSATLNFLIDLLDVATGGCPMPVPQGAGVDRQRVFNYNGKRVGVCTQGDTRGHIIDNCRFFVANRCDVAITATRAAKGTQRELENLERTHGGGTPVKWVRRFYDGYLEGGVFHDSALQSSANLLQAESIFRLI